MTLPILPPVLSWTQKEQLSRKRGVIKQVIFKKQAKNPKFLISSSWHSENKTSAQNLIKYKVIFNTVVQVSSLGHSCGSPYIPCCLRGWLRAMWTDESSAAKGRPASFSCSGLLWMWGRKTLLFRSFLPPSQPSPRPGACSSHWDKPDEGGVHPQRGTCDILYHFCDICFAYSWIQKKWVTPPNPPKETDTSSYSYLICIIRCTDRRGCTVNQTTGQFWIKTNLKKKKKGKV